MNRRRVSLRRWEAENVPVWQAYRDHPNYLVMHYEDIILRPGETMRSVFDWLDVQEYDMQELPWRRSRRRPTR